MREICIFVKTFEIIFTLYVWIMSYVYFREVPHYYDKEVQFIYY